jgi:H+-transporting ATPase
METTASEPDAEGDLKSLPMPELQAKLKASLDGLTQAEALKRLTQYGRTRLKKRRPIRS